MNNQHFEDKNESSHSLGKFIQNYEESYQAAINYKENSDKKIYKSTRFLQSKDKLNTMSMFGTSTSVNKNVDILSN